MFIPIIIIFLSCCSLTFGATISKIPLTTPPLIGHHDTAGDIFLGGFSGLNIISNNNEIEILTITDRGPYSSKHQGFLLTSFCPQIVKLKIYNNSLLITDSFPITIGKNKFFSGLPNVAKKTSKSFHDEKPSYNKTHTINFDKFGIDAEGIAKDKSGNIWLVDEYSMSIIKLSPKGQFLNKFIPENSKGRFGHKTLPSILSHRKLNRGFEGITIIDNNLYAIVQSPIPLGTWEKDKTVLLLQFNISTLKSTALFLYYLNKEGKKIGGLTKNKHNNILLLEQNGKTDIRSYKTIFELNIENATNLINLNKKVFSKKEYEQKNIDPIEKKLFLNLDQFSEIKKYKKIEGFSIFNNEIYLITDNDFGIFDVINSSSKRQKKSVLFKIKK